MIPRRAEDTWRVDATGSYRPTSDARRLRLATRKLTLEFGVELSTDLSYALIAELFKQ